MSLRGCTQQPEDTSGIVHSSDRVPSLSSETVAPYAVEYSDGSCDIHGKGEPWFKISVESRAEFNRLLNLDPYSVAVAFVNGTFSVEGDLIAAVHFYYRQPRPWFQVRFWAALAQCGIGGFESWLQTKTQAARNIRFHYDQSNDFYRQFLDSRMVYSCAYFKDPDQSLDEAQLRKLGHICRKLDLRAGERFLDIGCGWGGLIAHAAENYGTLSTGCTLSVEQFNFVSKAISECGLNQKVRVELSDYREIEGSFEKIASVGMFEHVGRRRLDYYFDVLYRLLQPGGLVLNHGITRPETTQDGPETLFVRRYVFPGGELPRLSDVIRLAERVGFEVLDVENLRPHYALTCRAWVRHLQENVTHCLRQVDRSVYRTWLLALAASAACFADGRLNLNQVLLYKPGDPARRPFTREYVYG